MEEHLGKTLATAPFGTQNEAGCASQDLHEVDGSVALNTAPHYTCAANTMDPVTLEDHMAQLAFIGVGEM